MILHLETLKKALLLASSEVVDRPPPSMKLPKCVRLLRSCLVFQLFKMTWLAGYQKVHFSLSFGGVHGQGHVSLKKKNKTKGSFALGFRSVDLISLDNP